MRSVAEATAPGWLGHGVDQYREVGLWNVIIAPAANSRRITGNLGVKASDKSISFGMAWTMAGIMGLVWRLFRLKGEPPITRQMLRLIGKPFTVRTDKAGKELGYSPRVTWKEGIAEMTTT
jgi:hypothetical protein